MSGLYAESTGGNAAGDLQKLINSGALLVDVREPYEVDMDPVPGAINIPLPSIPDELEKFRNSGDIIVFCRSGNRSYVARKFLKSQGIKGVVDGGSFLNILKLQQ